MPFQILDKRGNFSPEMIFGIRWGFLRYLNNYFQCHCRNRKRLTAEACLTHSWLAQTEKTMNSFKLPTDKLKKFIIRRKWQVQYLSTFCTFCVRIWMWFLPENSCELHKLEIVILISLLFLHNFSHVVTRDWIWMQYLLTFWNFNC